MQTTFLLRANHPIVKNHVVHGQKLLPGLAYIDMLFQLFKKNSHDPAQLELKNLSIYAPLVVKEDHGVRLTIDCQEKEDGFWQITVEGHEEKNNKPISEKKRYITAEMHRREPPTFEETSDITALKESAKSVIDLETIYKESRKQELVHSGMIKAEGNIYELDTGTLIEISVSEKAMANAMESIFHPALIDGSAMAAAAQFHALVQGEERLFLPLFYESFRAFEPIQKRCITGIQNSSVKRTNELLHATLEFFNDSGQKIGELKNLTCKLVRDAELIQQDQKQIEESVSIPTSSTVDSASVVNTVQQAETKNTATSATTEYFLKELIANRLGKSTTQIDVHASYYEIGLNSPDLLEIVRTIEEKIGTPLSPTLLFEYTTVDELSTWLAENHLSKFESVETTNRIKTDESQEKKPEPTADSTHYTFHEEDTYLQDHLVYGQPALMGVTHPSLVLESYIQNHPNAYPVELRNVQFQGGPVTLKKAESAKIRVNFPEVQGKTAFATSHYIDDSRNSKPCCKGDSIATVETSPQTMDLKGMIKQSKPIDQNRINGWYNLIKGFQLGPMLQTIESAYEYDKETTISKVQLSKPLQHQEKATFLFDPLLLNSCYLVNSGEGESDNLYIPLAIESLTLFRPMTKTAYIVKSVRSQKPGFFAFDAQVLTEEGECIAEVLNASVKEVANAAALSNASFESQAVTIQPEKEQPKVGAIAIVGLSGRYPKAKNLQEFWQNLRDGKDCITEIPTDRWNHGLYFDVDKNRPGRTYSKWGGFMDGVDRFDPLFFNISPREAEILDPQERLFLQCLYETMEDAGYTRQTPGMSGGSPLKGTIGVYVGVMNEEYPLYGAQNTALGQPGAASGSPSSVANRVSWFCNFHGPSMAVDTMCSSSLTAIDLACKSLRLGECDVAFAGGVNLSIHPNKYLLLAQGKFVSSKGRCESFGKGGDGYVPGEGVGAVMLKPLSNAVDDHDHVYGIIRATAINHGGKTSGYSVPNPKSQAAVIEKAFNEADIDPRMISYIEAHGTGTSIGDPIEIAGLSKVFQKQMGQKQFCAIGSVKSNIGHCESAAGIGALTKVLLQLKHGQLVPSLHSKELNPNIDFSKTPFVVQQELTEWKRPIVSIDGKDREFPRIAGISSFGAGGSNAHLVIEEYIPKSEAESVKSETGPWLIPLSAKNGERLKEMVKNLLHFTLHSSPFHLSDLAYTLQVGRETMDERLAVIANTVEELNEKLEQFLNNEKGITNLFHGRIQRDQGTVNALTSDEDMLQTVEMWRVKGKYTKILDLWVQGLPFDWNQLYSDQRPNRITLPTYPFAQDRYWIPVVPITSLDGSGKVGTIHPLLHQNRSGISGLRFTSTFTGKEFFLDHHRVNGEQTLPGVAYLEMVRAAVDQILEGTEPAEQSMVLKNIAWIRPFVVKEQEKQLHIDLFQEESGDMGFEIYGDPEQENAAPTIYSQGSISFRKIEPNKLDLTAEQNRCDRGTLTAKACYEAFNRLGLSYGPAHQGIQTIYPGENRVLAKLALPAEIANTGDHFVLHPSLLDSALQASMGLTIETEESKQALPFALQELEITGTCSAEMWALIRYSEGSGPSDKVQKLDVDLCDSQGEVVFRLKGFSSRITEEKSAPKTIETPKETTEPTELSESTDIEADTQEERAIQFFKTLLSSTLKLPVDQIDSTVPMETYGIDSVMIMSMTDELEKTFGSLSKTLFFEYDNIRDLTLYFLDSHQEQLTKLLGLTNKIEDENSPPDNSIRDTNSNRSDFLKKSKVNTPLEGGQGGVTLNQTKQSEIADWNKKKSTYNSPLEGGRGVLSATFHHQGTQFKKNRLTPPNPPQGGNGTGSIQVKGIDSDQAVTKYVRSKATNRGALEVAIVGLSGRYPQANNTQEYWQNLKEGRDCITEIPSDRWDHSLYFDEDRDKPGKTYSKWGGFLNDVDKFDPLFFNIAPREAQIMDPQERLFLQCVHETMEDAGYTRESLSHPDQFDVQKSVGVFVGVMYEEYQLYGAQDTILGKPNVLTGSPASIANRVSWFYNFHGPSMAVDTMCSSSLTTIHLACESLQQNRCAVAIAGGVNLSLHPNKYLLLGTGKFVSSKGRCETFGEGGDGYVPGEGVGAIMLKPLSTAVADNDQIYGVIKATAVNHGGKTNGYSVPSPNAQAAVIEAAFVESGIDPANIGYIEAHGTGTSLGDPIEITGLSKAFRKWTDIKQFCAIGSAKSNIGHCESAAGIGGVTKVLLQLKHGQLVPSLHSKTLNPNINFSETPFVVQQELTEWKRPVTTANGETKELPRLAGISSFGAGGSNAHIIIEEYLTEPKEQNLASESGPYLILLSAKTEEQLKDMTTNLQRFILSASQKVHLSDVAYTLQVGREAMEERLALIVNSFEDLSEKLELFLENRTDTKGLYQGRVKRNRETMKSLATKAEITQMIETWQQTGDYTQIPNLWIKGVEFDWNQLYGENRPNRITLPTYPFAKERYWGTELLTAQSELVVTNKPERKSEINSEAGTEKSPIQTNILHPLLHRNTSDLMELRFTSTFTGEEPFLTGFPTDAEKTFPEIACLEMARAALDQAAGSLKDQKDGIRFNDIVWGHPPIITEEPLDLHITLTRTENNRVTYEIYSDQSAEPKEAEVHNRGNATFCTVDNDALPDIQSIKQRLSGNQLNADQCYEALEKVGFTNSETGRVIEKIYEGENKLLVEFSATEGFFDEMENSVQLHPGLLNSALMATALLMPLESTFPISIEELKIFDNRPTKTWAWIRSTTESSTVIETEEETLQLDIDLCNELGILFAKIKGLKLFKQT